MRNTIKIDRPAIKNCGGKKGKGGCGSNWAGASQVKTAIKIAA